MRASHAAASPSIPAAPSTIEPPSASPAEDPVDDPVDDPVSAAVHAVIDLFGTQLAKVSFPDVDAAALRRQADELRAAAAAVNRARSALDAALAASAARAAALGDTARRAVAYAQIYSAAHPERRELAAALAGLSEPAPAAAEPAVQPRRRGRPPRRSAELFDAAASPALQPDAEPA